MSVSAFKKISRIILFVFILSLIFLEFCDAGRSKDRDDDGKKGEHHGDGKKSKDHDDDDGKKGDRKGDGRKGRRHSPEKNDWESYKAHHKKTYKDDGDQAKRLSYFVKKEKRIAEHNSRYEQKLVTYELELNKFADEDDDELKATKRGFQPLTDNEVADFTGPAGQAGRALTTPLDIPIPKSLDWRDLGAVTPVKDQGECGCCYAFAAIAALESQVFIKTKKLVVLSEQMLINCDSSNLACEGGNYLKSWKHLSQPGRIYDDAMVPYTSGSTSKLETCIKQPSGFSETISNYRLLGKNETLIQQYLVKFGPLAISFNSNDLFNYAGGIYDCPPGDSGINHAVLLIGYGTDETGLPYWILKNSWGQQWGMDGYFLLKRGTNACGISSQAAFCNI